ncbi:hypothetical protein Rsub_01238 [Raphidocelis subcapitata]|uniref:Flavodoxin-like domain-containing protein n=1 Tax=Raphidocelis subcapitata TaxID=307507 RepID=A0A2V0NSL1_9CHLO|nr:hypothetical protein Rsub_01238 [Raphidocelis subcapitata]|eukprot:GBF88523.1 hypothetical protein Rsub_01238 [Raphidocelis subcapitata]
MRAPTALRSGARTPCGVRAGAVPLRRAAAAGPAPMQAHRRQAMVPQPAGAAARDVRARALDKAPNATAQAPAGPPAAAPVATDGVTALEITPHVTLLRGSTRERLKYEIEYALKRGTTENTYLVAVPNSAARVLVDVPNQAFADDFVACLQQQTDLANISHVVITHMAPNRFPSLAALLERLLAARGPGAPPVQVVVSNPLIKVLQSGMTGDGAGLLERVRLVPVLGESQIALPGGHSLTAICTPTPRWPDLMVVYDPESRVAFTSKLFSAHVAPGTVSEQDTDQPFDSFGGWEAYSEHWRYFFDCMLAPVAKQAAAALDKLPLAAAPRAAFDRPADFLASLADMWTAAMRGLGGGAFAPAAPAAGNGGGGNALFTYALAPQHGPVVRTCLAQLVREYSAWAAAQVEALEASSVAVLYASAYGNTAALAQAISRGVTKGGIAVNTVNLELSTLDEVVAAVKQADGFIIGSPTLGGHMPTQVQLALGSILREANTRQLPCGVFGSFGWSGEAVDEMEAKLKDGGYGFAFDAIRVKFKPSAKDLMTCEQAGRDLAVQVKRRLKARERGATAGAASIAASGAQLAMGRVVGSLCVVTARDEDATNAMLASWVSQASFDPPGLTIAVKKDRAMETTMTPGNKFAVSMLAEGRYKSAMKVLTKPFQPGQDRLAGLETRESEASGCPVLAEASAHLDCEVVSRMDAADHWVVYAHVVSGAVDNDSVLTAVHHRKVGNHY